MVTSKVWEFRHPNQLKVDGSSKITQGPYDAAPIRRKRPVYGKVLIAFIVPENPVPEKLMGQFDPVLIYDLIFIGRIIDVIDDTNPGIDAGQCPHIKIYLVLRADAPEAFVG